MNENQNTLPPGVSRIGDCIAEYFAHYAPKRYRQGKEKRKTKRQNKKQKLLF